MDISKSLSPFVMVFDRNKNLLATSGMIGSSKPNYPKGIFDNVAKNSEERVTWQPQTRLRFATVAFKYRDGYIVAARSLYETENQIEIIGRLVAMAWLACVGCSIIALMVIYLFIKKVFKIKFE